MRSSYKDARDISTVFNVTYSCIRIGALCLEGDIVLSSPHLRLHDKVNESDMFVGLTQAILFTISNAINSRSHATRTYTPSRFWAGRSRCRSNDNHSHSLHRIRRSARRQRRAHCRSNHLRKFVSQKPFHHRTILTRLSIAVCCVAIARALFTLATIASIAIVKLRARFTINARCVISAGIALGVFVQENCCVHFRRFVCLQWTKRIVNQTCSSLTLPIFDNDCSVVVFEHSLCPLHSQEGQLWKAQSSAEHNSLLGS